MEMNQKVTIYVWKCFNSVQFQLWLYVPDVKGDIEDLYVKGQLYIVDVDMYCQFLRRNVDLFTMKIKGVRRQLL